MNIVTSKKVQDLVNNFFINQTEELLYDIEEAYYFDNTLTCYEQLLLEALIEQFNEKDSELLLKRIGQIEYFIEIDNQPLPNT